MRVVMVFCLVVSMFNCYAQDVDRFENANFKIIQKGNHAQGIIFKADSSRKVLHIRDINSYLKLGLPFKEGDNEDSNPCWMIYDSSLHHIDMIDTLFNHGISKAGVSIYTRVNLFKKHVIVSSMLTLNLDEWNKTLMYGGKIYDVNGSQIFEAVGLPEKVLKLGLAQIDSSSKYLAAIRSENFLILEGGQSQPLDFYLDFFSLPEMKFICTKEIPKDFVLHVHRNIFWLSFQESDNSRIPRYLGRHYYFYDLDKNKCSKIFLQKPLNFKGFRNENDWAIDGIFITNTNDESKEKKFFERDFIVEDIIKK